MLLCVKVKVNFVNTHTMKTYTGSRGEPLGLELLCISCWFVPLTLNIPRGVLRGPPLVCYWLTSVEINKHKIFDTNNA